MKGDQTHWEWKSRLKGTNTKGQVNQDGTRRHGEPLPKDKKLRDALRAKGVKNI